MTADGAAVAGDRRLSTEFCGIDFQNPVLLAAGTAAYGEELDDVVQLDRLGGIVTKVVKDKVMAQVEMICGPYRLVSLMSSEAADELGLEPGVRAIASVKSTNVVVERP